MKTIIKNALTILPDGERVCSVFIDGDKIAAIDYAPKGFAPEKTIDGSGRLLIPGLVNAHTHIYMTALRNRADDLNFMTWLFDKIIPMESLLTDEDAYWSIQLGCMEMLLSGTTALLDMHLYPLLPARALSDAGIRAVIGCGLNDTKGIENGMARIRHAEQEMNEYGSVPTLSFMLAPHAPYTCSEEYLRLIAERARELGIGIHTHLSESVDEQKQIIEKYGCTPSEYFDRCGILTDKTTCAHCVHLTDSDIELLAKRRVNVAHNPASNMKLGNGFARMPQMLECGINVAIGTDGCCSNNNQSMLHEMSLAALIHKGTAGEATVLPASKVFEMATKNGAKALGVEGEIGEVKVGMKADLALFNLDTPGFFPLGDPKSALCYASAGLNAETVLVGGKTLLNKGEFTTIDSEKLRYHINKISDKLGKG